MRDRVDLPLCLMKIGDAHCLSVAVLDALGNQFNVVDEVIWTFDIETAPNIMQPPVALTRANNGQLCNVLAVAEGQGLIFVHRTGEEPEAVARYLVHNHRQNYRVALVAACTAGAADLALADDDIDPLGEDSQLNPESLTTKEIDLPDIAPAPVADGVSVMSIAHPTEPVPAAPRQDTEAQAPNLPGEPT